MHFEYLAACAVKPRHDDELITGRNSCEDPEVAVIHGQPGIRRAVRTLLANIELAVPSPMRANSPSLPVAGWMRRCGAAARARR